MSFRSTSRRDFVRSSMAAMLASRTARLPRLLGGGMVSAPQPFDLTIEFSGLCMFIPPANPVQGSPVMYVLMPRAGLGTPGVYGGRVLDKHHAALFIDEQYVMQVPVAGVQRYSLDRYQLTITPAPCTLAANPVTCQQNKIGDLCDLLQKTVSGYYAEPYASLFTDHPRHFLASCLALPCGTFDLDTTNPNTYTLKGNSFTTRSTATWRIRNITTLSMALQAYDQDDSEPIALQLQPPTDGSTLPIKIYNVMKAEEPGINDGPMGSKQQLLAHFTAYYDLFARHPFNPPGQALVPDYQDCPQGNCGPGGTGPYSCMLTGGH